MLKKLLHYCYNYSIWLALLVCTDFLFIIFLWLLSPGKFLILLGAMLFVSFLMFSIALWIAYSSDSKKEKAYMELLENRELAEDESFLTAFGGTDYTIAQALVKRLQSEYRENKKQKSDIQEYEDYMETWAHEVKTPLALMTFVLDNRKEEMSTGVFHKLEYARSQLQEDIDQVLYYAGLKAVHSDFLFEKVSLRDCCTEALSEYRALLDEAGFLIQNETEDIGVLSDRKGLIFIIGQAVSNSIKYADPEKEKNTLKLYTEWAPSRNETMLHIRDNGIGVPEYDIPFIFDKGFTGGNLRQRKKATGMGLYLVKELAKRLKIRVGTNPEYKTGFELVLAFPRVSK
ncbi:sensor histidine kinase [Clostridium sp. AF19-22AC]|jgi:signal transduction histidine kinase|uniref:sensor histidine kinase n=1 Tax=Clostridia TaxID=186801 RepID=UPI000E4D9705|nr:MULTISPECIES: sensor histidine kinase [Clostridia]RHR32592.1 sensor histidine kinase [Clostridium sp. AF19-22AC]